MRWNHLTSREEAARHYARHFKVNPLTAQVMMNRGVEGIEEMYRFLFPELRLLRDPFGLKDMDRAVERVRLALERGERIHIHGDYDVDGLSATSLLVLALRRLRADVHYRVVQRSDSSVGLSVEALEREHLPDQPALIITADCGSNNADAVDVAAEQGVDVIIIDHHRLSERIPQCAALLNPHQPGDTYPFKDLAAVGMAYHFVRALDAYLKRDEREWPTLPLADYVDIVALGTVADVVPLIDDNRIFVREGLELLRSARRPGICALMRSAKIINNRPGNWAERFDARTIGFRLAPLINAAGRMGDASRCVELLSTDSYRVAVRVADELVGLNQERQRCEKEILREAQQLADEACEAGDDVIVLAKEHWHPGVLGIVASRLCERLNRPAVIAAIDERGIARGSIRAPSSINMLSALERCDSLLETWGGHPAAAGLQFKKENLERLREGLNQAVRDGLPEGVRLERTIDIDATVELSELDEDTLRELQSLAPFGVGNPAPILATCNLQPLQPRVQGSTLRVRLRQGGDLASAVGYGLSRSAPVFRTAVDVVFSPRPSRDERSRNLSMTLLDVKKTAA